MGANPIIVLLNNAYYVIEEEIHQGPYNRLVSWDYAALARAMSGGSENLFTAKARAHRPMPASTLGASVPAGGDSADRAWG